MKDHLAKARLKIARTKILASALYSIQFYRFEETSCYWSGQLLVLFSSAFHLSPSIGKFCMTTISSVKTTESYVVCRLGHLYRNGPRRAGLTIASDKTVRAVHSCNSWLSLFIVLMLHKTKGYISHWPFKNGTSVLGKLEPFRGHNTFFYFFPPSLQR